MYKLVRNGQIFTDLAKSKRKIRLPEPPRSLTTAEIDDLVAMSTAVGMRRFKQNLEQGKWIPGRGASLTTSAVNKTKLAFVDEYKKFFKETFGKRPISIQIDSELHPAMIEAEPSVSMDRLMAQLPQRARTTLNEQILEHLGDGSKQVDVAIILDMTAKQIEGRVGTFREHISIDILRPTSRGNIS
jgi:uncharacterized protein YbcI